jgi:hypothetical protein
MQLPKEYISYNQIRLYQSCPKKYYYTYIEEIQTPINDKIFLGIIFHAALEYYFQKKINGIIINNIELMDQFNTLFEHESRTREIIWSESQGDTKSRGISFIRYFIKEMAGKIEPIMVEKELDINIPEYGIRLKGVIDLVESNFSITDFKTTTSKWSKDKFRQSYLQLVIYKYLFEQSFGNVISDLKIRIFYAKNAKNIRHQELAVKKDDLSIDSMFKIISYVTDNISKGVFYKNETFFCGFCQYKEHCRSHGD